MKFESLNLTSARVLLRVASSSWSGSELAATFERKATVSGDEILRGQQIPSCES